MPHFLEALQYTFWKPQQCAKPWHMPLVPMPMLLHKLIAVFIFVAFVDVAFLEQPMAVSRSTVMALSGSAAMSNVPSHST